MRWIAPLVLLLWARAAEAQPRLSLWATTTVPVDVGAKLGVEFGPRLLASTEVGILPGAYVDGINATVRAFGGYDQNTADLIRSSLDSSLVWRTHVGWRPFTRAGFYLEAGFGLVSLGGGATAPQLIAAATGRPVPDTSLLVQRSFDVHSTLDQLDVELGWDFPLSDQLHLRTAIGGIFTLDASTTITPRYTPGPAFQKLTSAFEQAGADYLDNTYRHYIQAPVITVAVGYALLR